MWQDFLVNYQRDILGKNKDEIQQLANRLFVAQLTKAGRQNDMNDQPEWVKKLRPVHNLGERARRNTQPNDALGSADNPIVLD